jgi:DNA repair protein RadC
MSENPIQSNTIKDWSQDDRPREKMISKGRFALSDSELLAIIIGSGSVGESAVDLSKRILNDHGNNLNELGKISIKTLVQKYKGVGEAKAINILACLELGRRRQASDSTEKPTISSSKDAFNIFTQYVADHFHEEFWVMFLNRGMKMIKVERIGIGNIKAVLVDARTVIKLALEHNASGVILCHNHPSGTLKPSTADKTVTRDIKKAGELFDISVQDHIIVGDNNYYSFADDGILDQL